MVGWIFGWLAYGCCQSSANGQCQWSVPMPMQEPVPVATVGMPFGRLRYDIVGLIAFCEHPIYQLAHM